MTKINIAELIGTPNAIIQKFGLQVFDEAVALIDSGNGVLLNFSDLKNTTTGFFHACIGNLYKKYGEDFFQLVKVSGLDKKVDWEEKYDEAISLVKNPDQASEIDYAIAKLFE